MTLFDNIFAVVGLVLLAIVALRCFFIFVYPLFCCIEPKITNNENNENTNNLHYIINNENNIVTTIDLNDIPLVEVSLEDHEETAINIPIATLV
jgi:hypothetical protein